MKPDGTLLPLIDRLRTRAFLVGVVATVAAVAGAFFVRGAHKPGEYNGFDRAYLFTYVFFLGLSLGSLALLMVHRQLGGAWGFLIRRPLEAGAMTLPLMAVLFVPILVDLERIYPWVSHPPGSQKEEGGNPAPEGRLKASDNPVSQASPVVVHAAGETAGSSGTRRDPLEATTADLFAFKKLWLNPTAFTIRVAIYFVIWIALAVTFYLGSGRQDRTSSTSLAYGLQSLSAPGLVLYFLTSSLAFIDWGMSLQPEWYSSIYGVLVMIGQGVSTVAFMILVATIISRRGETEGLDTPETFNDLGNLLLAFVMLWAYLSFSQYLIIWSGNLAEEIPWYTRRLRGGWEWIGRFLMVFHFALPFLILLSRPAKRNIRVLWVIAALVLGAHLVDTYWLIAPSFGEIPRSLGSSITLFDLILPVAIGGFWLAAFLWLLRGRPLMIAQDPELLPALKQAGGH